MIIQVSQDMFLNMWTRSGRGEAWTRAGLIALFEYLEEAYDCTYEPDVIALDGEFAEYQSLAHYNEACGTAWESATDIDGLVAVTYEATFVVEQR